MRLRKGLFVCLFFKIKVIAAMLQSGKKRRRRERANFKSKELKVRWGGIQYTD